MEQLSTICNPKVMSRLSASDATSLHPASEQAAKTNLASIREKWRCRDMEYNVRQNHDPKILALNSCSASFLHLISRSARFLHLDSCTSNPALPVSCTSIPALPISCTPQFLHCPFSCTSIPAARFLHPSIPALPVFLHLNSCCPFPAPQFLLYPFPAPRNTQCSFSTLKISALTVSHGSNSGSLI